MRSPALACDRYGRKPVLRAVIAASGPHRSSRRYDRFTSSRSLACHVCGLARIPAVYRAGSEHSTASQGTLVITMSTGSSLGISLAVLSSRILSSFGGVGVHRAGSRPSFCCRSLRCSSGSPEFLAIRLARPAVSDYVNRHQRPSFRPRRCRSDGAALGVTPQLLTTSSSTPGCRRAARMARATQAAILATACFTSAQCAAFVSAALVGLWDYDTAISCFLAAPHHVTAYHTSSSSQRVHSWFRSYEWTQRASAHPGAIYPGPSYNVRRVATGAALGTWPVRCWVDSVGLGGRSRDAVRCARSVDYCGPHRTWAHRASPRRAGTAALRFDRSAVKRDAFCHRLESPSGRRYRRAPSSRTNSGLLCSRPATREDLS